MTDLIATIAGGIIYTVVYIGVIVLIIAFFVGLAKKMLK
jgi:hypothetical protein